MSNRKTHVAIAALALSNFLFCSPASAQTVVAWWSQIIGSDTAPDPTGALNPLNLHARFVIHDSNISALHQAQSLCDRYVLADQNDETLKVHWTARYNSQHFSDYTVCDAALPEDQMLKTAVLKDASNRSVESRMRQRNGAAKTVDVQFPGPHPVGRSGNGIRMAVFGDSGCRGTVRRGSQRCSGNPLSQSSDWVFPDLIDDSLDLTNQADFVLHVGDYRYLDQSNSRNTWDWEHWQADLFDAAQPSFAQMPWAFSRGNHEVCDQGQKYSGVGYFLFFGRDKTDCDSRSSLNVTTLMKPWFFDVADRASASPKAHHRIIMLDNASNSDASTHIEDYKTAFEWAQIGWSGARPSAWIASHRPIFGLDTDQEDQNDTRDLGFIQSALTTVDAGVRNKCIPYNSKTCGLKAIIGGHQHNLQNVVFPTDMSDAERLLPQQFVVGNSGVRLREKTKGKFTHILHDALLSGCQVSQNDPRASLGAELTGAIMDWRSRENGHRYEYGYVLFTRDGTQTNEQSGWAGDARFAYTSQPTRLAGQLGTANQAGTGCVVQP